jgi:hypothetical protein
MDHKFISHKKWIGVVKRKLFHHERCFEALKTFLKENKILSLWSVSNAGDRWNHCWRRRLYAWEEAQLVELEEMLAGLSVSPGSVGKCVWKCAGYFIVCLGGSWFFRICMYFMQIIVLFTILFSSTWLDGSSATFYRRWLVDSYYDVGSGFCWL